MKIEFYRLLEQAVLTPPMTYKQTIRPGRPNSS
jgi:hypothetical protein